MLEENRFSGRLREQPFVATQRGGALGDAKPTGPTRYSGSESVLRTNQNLFHQGAAPGGSGRPDEFRRICSAHTGPPSTRDSRVRVSGSGSDKTLETTPRMHFRLYETYTFEGKVHTDDFPHFRFELGVSLVTFNVNTAASENE